MMAATRDSWVAPATTHRTFLRNEGSLLPLGNFPARTGGLILASLFALAGACVDADLDVHAKRSPVVVTLVGTSDLHGHIEAVPLLGAHVEALRQLRQGHGGGVVLVDAGDTFQGTLASNLQEGVPVIEAYNLLGFDALSIGNHEFDFGPEGQRVTPGSGEDPRGALKELASRAEFPFLASNLVETATGRMPDWENVFPSTVIDSAGYEIGIIGITTSEMVQTTMAENFAGLAPVDAAVAVAARARALRRAGADLIIAAAHLGGRCSDFDDPSDLSSCDPGSEVFELAYALPAGTLDAIVAGHTHAAVAHEVAGIPVVQAYAHGRAFGRVDFVVEPETGEFEPLVHPPQDLCAEPGADPRTCLPAHYDYNVDLRLEVVTEVLDVALAAQRRAAQTREEDLGAVVEGVLEHDRNHESPAGNWIADLVRRTGGTDVGLIDGGTVRASLPGGPLSYGELYDALPFENRLGRASIRSDELELVIASNLQSSRAALSISGLRAVASCDSGSLRVRIYDEEGVRMPQTRRLTISAPDYVLRVAEPVLARSAADVTFDGSALLRDRVAGHLRQWRPRISAPEVFSIASPRVQLSEQRPVACPDPSP